MTSDKKNRSQENSNQAPYQDELHDAEFALDINGVSMGRLEFNMNHSFGFTFLDCDDCVDREIKKVETEIEMIQAILRIGCDPILKLVRNASFEEELIPELMKLKVSKEAARLMLNLPTRVLTGYEFRGKGENLVKRLESYKTSLMEILGV